ncbi:putative Pilus assembly protein CpaC [Nitrospira defluvii]|jgi:pilus assembly protein CpaC|uniref:Putative Pilus assembly protein CpaC n=1 Tax=Nitrospira defluvii TaxID=330214 RepID=D8PF27_9BACT|nr:putative Pilus assembly protein CpaC [Nitrospira defluvii]
MTAWGETYKWTLRGIGSGLFALFLVTVAQAHEVASPDIQTRVPRSLSLITGKSLVLDSPIPFSRASIANPDIADTLVLSPKQLYVIGKAAGTTNLTLWDAEGSVYALYDLAVSPDLTRLKEHLHQLFPDENDLQVMAAHDRLTLTGTVSSATHVSEAVDVAETYARQKVINLLRVGGLHQVMLEVRVAEMERTLLRRLGVNLAAASGGQSFGVSSLKNLATVLPPTDPSAALVAGPVGLGVSQAVNALLRFQTGSTSWTGFIDALKEENLVKVLAEPTLVALSGQEAHFLAGGEFPIPVPQAFGVTTIQFKKFGIQLNFNPVVLSPTRISVTVAPEVSDLDFANGLSLQGFVVPAITTRRASTVVELEDGQSFAVAGLLRDTVRETVSKFPVLGDIPILGALFRSSSFQKNETELVIIVTPHLVTPVTEAELPLPTGQYLEPDDVDFYLMGRLQSRKDKVRTPLPPATQLPFEDRLAGPVGHMMP